MFEQQRRQQSRHWLFGKLAGKSMPPVGLGCVALIFATLFFSLQDAETKILLEDYSVWQLVFVRFLSFMMVLFGFSFMKGDGPTEVIRSHRPVLQLIRGSILIAEIALIGLSFKFLGLAEAMTIFHVFPMIGVVIAVIALGERASLITIVVLIAGFIGVVIIVGPGTNLQPFGVFLALGAALCYAIYLVLTRVASFIDRSETSLFYVCLMGILLPVLLGWSDFVSIKAEHAWDFVRLCIFNMIGQTCIVLAFSKAPSTILQPLNYVQIVWAAIIGYLIFADVPDLTTWIGGGLIIGAGLLQLRASRVSDMQ